MSNTIREFGVTGDRFVPKIPSPRPPLPRMMTAKPVKLRTVSTGEQEPNNSVEDNIEESSDSDSLGEDEVDDAPDEPESSYILAPPKTPPGFSDEISNIKKKNAKEPEKIKTQIHHKFLNLMKSDTKRNYCLIPFVVLLATIALSYAGVRNNSLTSTEHSTEDTQSEVLKNFENNIDNISNRFKKQNSEIWNDIIAGVSEVVEYPDKLSIILLFSHDDNLMSCLAKMIGNATKAALRSSEEIFLSPSQLGDDSGIVLNKFKNKIATPLVVIVDNLLDVNPEAMKAFHHLCDRHTPMVTNVVYILTMVAKGYENNKNPVKFVEDQLKLKLQGQIDSDKIDPLITRMTDGVVIPVQPEPDFINCPLRY